MIQSRASLWVEYDELLAFAGLIEPEYVEQTVGWQNEEEMADAGMIPVYEYGSAVPVGWLNDGSGPHLEPIPVVERVLRWRMV